MSGKGKTVHGEAANAGHRVLAPDDAEVEAYLETALHAPGPDRAASDRPATAERGVVAVLDFGSQFAQLIARRVRELNVYSELLPHDTPLEELERRGVGAVILSGGPNSVYDDDAPKPDPRDLERPAARARHLLRRPAHGERARRARAADAEARVRTGDGHDRNRGRAVRRPRSDAAGLDEPRRLRSPPCPRASRPPPRPIRRRTRGWSTTLGTCTASSSIPRSRTRPTAGTSCATSSSGSPASRRPGRPRASSSRPSPRSGARVDDHAREVGSDGKVICALSGGVDSAVAAALVHRAVGDRLTCIYVDHGLMRKRESELLRATFEQNLGMNLVMIDARERFLARLAGRHRPRAEAPDHRRRVHPRLRGAGRGARPDRLPDPGHALPGRHRERDLRDEDRAEDQDAPQRRRPAGRPAVQAHRAAALPVQGRGSRRRAGARPARRRWSIASRSRARGSRSGSSAR